jgi:hypothetical protein
VITRAGLISTVGLSAFLWVQSTTNTMQCNEPQKPFISTGQVVGAFAAVGAVVVGTVVIVHVHKAHTTIKGCVSDGPDGMSVMNEQDKKTYALLGETANVKVGDRIQARGRRAKKTKGGPDDVFEISKMGKDYGVCKVPVISTAATGAAKS